MCGHGTVGGQPFCQYQLGLRLALCQPWNGSQYISTKQGNCIHLDLECKYRYHLRCEQQQQQAPSSTVVQPVWTCSSSSVQPLWACSQLLGRRLCCWIGRLCKCTNGESSLFQSEAYKCKEMTPMLPYARGNYAVPSSSSCLNPYAIPIGLSQDYFSQGLNWVHVGLGLSHFSRNAWCRPCKNNASAHR